MPSLVPGFEYDIFISYRQKDNRYDGWVTEFVQNLKKELDATLKEEVSIYFDENPHDGLLETHHVEESLKRKLKCLIFIPILSRTYCDPKSYAWSNEFLVFRDQAREDGIGPTVQLRNGNVTSRILPVRIHELEEQDRALFEKETGSPLRAVDFVFKATGVNRPLRMKDDEVKDTPHALYRDQINKVANAVGEILEAFSNPAPASERNQRTISSPHWTNLSRQRQFLSAAALLLLLAAGMAVFKAGDWLGGIEDKSIVVLPFENLSPDPDDKYLADGFHEEIISRLNVQKTLIVIAPQSANQAARAGWGSQEIASKLQVKYVLKGSVQKIGEDLRIITRLEEAKSAEVISSKTLDRKLHDFFDVQDEVAHRVVTDLGLRITGTIPEPRSLKAWEYARKAAEFNFLLPPDQARWKELMQKALNEDSTWLEAWYRWEWTHFLWFGNSGDSSDYLEGMKARDKILAKDRDSFVGRYSVIAYDYWIVNDYPKVIRQLEELLEDYPNSAQIWGTKGLAHRRNGEYQQFIDSYRQLLRLNPLARGAMRELAETLVGLAHFDQAMHFRREIRDTGIDRYYGIPFNAALLNGRLENLRTIVAEAGNDPKCPPFLKADVESRAKANGFLYRRQYDSLLSSRWTSMDSYDSALIYYLKGDMPGSIASCSRCISKYGRLASSAGNIQVRKVHELNRTVCYAGAGNKDWKERLAAIRDGLIPFNLTFYFRNAALSGLIAGDYEFTMEALKQWQAQQCGYKPLGPAQPFELLVKNHPLLDPLRDKPGFDELWEGNHFKVKKLKLPKEWR